MSVSTYKSYNRMLSSTANQASAKHPPGGGARRGPRAAMALAALSGGEQLANEQCIIFSQHAVQRTRSTQRAQPSLSQASP